MDEIESWRQKVSEYNILLIKQLFKAFVLSRTDRLGRLITKTFDLILTIVRDGPNAEVYIIVQYVTKIMFFIRS